MDPFPPLGHTLTTYTNTYIYIYLQTRTKKIQRRGEYKSRRVSPFPPLCPSLTRVILFLVLPPYHHPSPSPFGQISKVFHLFCSFLIHFIDFSLSALCLDISVRGAKFSFKCPRKIFLRVNNIFYDHKSGGVELLFLVNVLLLSNLSPKLAYLLAIFRSIWLQIWRD